MAIIEDIYDALIKSMNQRKNLGLVQLLCSDPIIHYSQPDTLKLTNLGGHQQPTPTANPHSTLNTERASLHTDDRFLRPVVV